jgi:hypothetical protein
MVHGVMEGREKVLLVICANVLYTELEGDPRYHFIILFEGKILFDQSRNLFIHFLHSLGLHGFKLILV